MFRSSCTLFLLLITCALQAAPAPKSIWNRPIDPDKDCKITIKDGTVTMELPGGDHDLSPKRKRFNAPRLLCEMDGDFVMQVRVRALFRPSDKSSVDGEDPMIAAGLLLIPFERNYIKLDYWACRIKENQSNLIGFRLRGKKLGINSEAGFIPEALKPPLKQVLPVDEEQIYLRIERQGHSIHEAVGRNGKTWISNVSLEDLQGLRKKFKAGLAAYSTSTEPFKVRFDQFKLIRGRKKSK